MTDNHKILQDISLLYELSLSVGSTLDPKENCHQFLRTLISRKSLSFGALWLPRMDEDNQGLCDLYYIHPQFRQDLVSVRCPYTVYERLRQKPYFSINWQQDGFEDFVHEKKVEKGAYAIFKMGDLGFLKLFASNRPEGFSEMEMAQLKQVIDKLKISLDGCFAHGRLKEETEQRLVAQSALEVSNHRFADLFNNMYDALIVQDKYGNVLEANAAAWKLVGMDVGKVDGMNMLDFAHPDDIPKILAHAEQLRHHGFFSGLEVRILSKSGEIRYVQANSSAIFEHGKFAGSRDIVRDISAQKHSQDLLKESETKLRQIIDSSLDAVVSVERDGNVQEWNKQAAHMFGYTRKEVVGRKLVEVIIPERFRTEYRQFLRNYIQIEPGPIVNKRFEIKCVRKDGTEFHAELSINADKSNKNMLFIGFIRDITEQKKAKREVENARVRMATLIANLQAGILLEDNQRKIALVNHTFCTFFDIPAAPQALIGQDCSNAAQQAKHLFVDPDAFVRGVERAIQDRNLIENETLVMKDGRILERDFIPLFVEKTYQGHLWQYRDVTERHNAQKAIRESEEKYRGILDNMELGLLEVDLEERIIRTNNAFCKLTGYDDAELVGKKTLDVFVPKQSKAIILNELGQRKKNQSGVYEAQLQKKDGTIIWCLISGAPVRNAQGAIVGTIGIHFDLTARKKLETDLAEATLSAERARLAERQFLTHMSHEIRTPINAVIGMTHLLSDTHPSPIQKEYLESLRFSADSLLAIIDDMLDLSKIDAGALEFEQRPFDLSYLLAALQHTFQFKVQDKPVQLNLHLEAALETLVLGDPTRLNQILTNLLGNAVKFTSAGSIDLRMRVLERKGEQLRIEFSVQDTGIGIHEDKQQIIFENFRQADPQIGRKFGGTGLGLTIVKQLVELQGGAIRLESTPGKGATFTFYLPFIDSGVPVLSKAVTNRSRVHQEENKIPSGLNFLVVEDNLVNQKLICHTIRTWQSHFQVANNGLEALQLTQQHRFDVILMDIHMPELDGCETTLAIRRDEKNPNREVPIIALTAAAMPEEKRRALEAGMNGFLTKPIAPAMLQEYIVQSLHIQPSYAPKAPGPAFDLQHLLDLSNGDKYFVRDIIDTFLAETPAVLLNIQHLGAANDWESVGKLAHKLKPSFALLGMEALRAQALWLESNAKAATVDPTALWQAVETLVAAASSLFPTLAERKETL